MFTRYTIKLLGLTMLVFIMSAGVSDGGTYYLDPAGNDSNNGLSESAPWKTIARVNRAAFSPGDSILLKRGGVWREQLNIPSSGSSGNPITFGAYGMGDKPVINGAMAVNGWTRYNGSIYVADIGSLNIAAIKQLFVDGHYYDMAHYPNSGYLHVDANSTANNYLIDGDLARTQEEVAGSTVVIRLRHWQVNNRPVSSYDPGTHRIEWSEPYSYSPPPWAGYGYYLQGKLWMLDTAQEWYYDGAAKRLYLWLENGDDPSAHAVEVSSNSHGIYAGNRSFININDIAVKNAGENGIYLYNSPNMQAQNIEIYNSGINGAYLWRSDNTTVFNSKISSSISAGIEIRSSNSSSITNNEITNSGTVGRMLKNSYAGIHQNTGNNAIFKNNKIYYSGYAGISASSGTNNTVQNNFIDQTCIRLTDCGAIYTWGIASHDSQIIGNIVANSLGSQDGSAPFEASAKGIYLDGGVSRMTVKDNTVINASEGIQLKGDFETINNNNVFNARNSALNFSSIPGESYQDIDYIIPNDNTVTHNNFFNSTDANPSLNLYSNFGDDFDLAQRAIFDYNSYFQPYYEFFVTQGRKGYPRANYIFPEWQSVKSQDLNSKDVGSFYEIRPYKAASYIGGNLVTNSTFYANINNWSRWPSVASITWISSAGLDAGALRFANNGSASSNLTSTGFAMQAGRTYEVKFSVISSTWIDISAGLRTNTSPTNYLISNNLKIRPNRREVGFVFTSTQSIPSASFIVASNGVNSIFYIDNVAVREVNATYNDPSDDMSIQYNANNAAKTISLQGQRYCDVNNNIVEGSMTLEPYSSKILLSCFNNRDGFCNNRETYSSAPGEGCSVDSPDIIPPAVTISAPTDASKVSGTTAITGAASDNVAVSSVAVSIDGAAYRLASGTASWTFSLNTAALTNSSHTITARAVDTSGNASSAAITVTVNNSDTTLPVITSVSNATGTIGTALSYQITATNSPTSFSAAGLPAGLSVSTGGLISGTPTTIGTSSVTISAVNASGTGADTLTLSVYSACDVNRDWSTNVVDVQLQVNQALGVAACTSDLNRDGLCNVIDVQRDVNVGLGGACVIGP